MLGDSANFVVPQATLKIAVISIVTKSSSALTIFKHIHTTESAVISIAFSSPSRFNHWTEFLAVCNTTGILRMVLLWQGIQNPTVQFPPWKTEIQTTIGKHNSLLRLT
jgi:hypothetical protein